MAPTSRMHPRRRPDPGQGADASGERAESVAVSPSALTVSAARYEVAIMTRVAIVAVQNRFAIGITGPMDVLQKASKLAGDAQPSERRPALEVRLLAADRAAVTYPNGVTIVPSATIDEEPFPDVIVVPQLDDEDLGRSLHENRVYLPWLRAGYAQGACLASFCTGAFLLAETGLLANRTATTHWHFAEEFRRRYPLVRLKAHQLIVDAGNLVTSGAATSFLDLAIYLVD